MRDIKFLNKNQIEVRVAEVKDTAKGSYVSLLLYKTARTDMEMLDKTFGQMFWQCDYKVVDGKMYCGIGVFCKELDDWIWKWNVGTESNMEAEKGQASDAMKRAGFLWGIGTELYSAPRIMVWGDKCNISSGNGKSKCYDRFKVSEIAYDENGDICRLKIYNDSKKCECFTFDSDAPVAKQARPAEPPKFEKKADSPEAKSETKKEEPAKDDGEFVCSKCGAKISPAVANYSLGKYKKRLCMNCQKLES